MTKPIRVSQDDLKRVMAEKSDSELHAILYVQADEYTADALEVVREEFQKRNPDAPVVKELEAVSQQVKQMQEAPLSWPLRVVAFISSALLYGIPAASVYFYYVRRGEKQKARDWAKWGWSGFALFLIGWFVLRPLFSQQ